MRSTVLLFVTAVLLTTTVNAASLPSGTNPVATGTIGVFFDYQNRPAQFTIDTMEREIQSIMHPEGLEFSWQEMGKAKSEGVFADLVVVKFKGTCSGFLGPVSSFGHNTEPASLASTDVSDGRVLHFTEVHCDELLHYLSSNVAGLNEAARNQLYGRALGRIVAHEMWHIFAATEKHASGGIARACHSREELVQPVFVFDPSEQRVLREYAARALLSREANPEP